MNNHKFFATVLMLTFLVAGAVYADTWTTYNNSNTGGAIGNNTVNSSAVDSSSVKWFGTNGGGVAKYDGTTWTKYTSSAGLAGNTVNHIDFDSSGNKWVATSLGLSKYTGSSWTKYTTGNSGIAANNCLTVATEGTTVWIGLYSNGVNKYDGTTWINYTSANSGLANNRVTDAVVDSSGNKWFGTLTGVSKYDGTTWVKYTTAQGLANNSVKAVALDSSGNLWVGTLGGVNKYNGSSWTKWTTTNGLADNDNVSIEVASDGGVWVGSNGSGVSRFASSSWTIYNTTNGLAHNTVNGVDSESSTVIWFATGGGGVSKLEVGGVTPPIANFDGSPTSGNAPLTVNFTDTSTNTPTAWSWTFGDTGTSTAQNPSHQYTSAGTYTVTLTATNAGGSNMKTRETYITVYPQLNANFSANKTTGWAPLAVTFTSSSTGNICNYKWRFDANDGSSEWSDQNGTSHQWTYNNSGTYTVSLEVTECGTSTRDTEIKTGYITVSPQTAPTAAFSGAPLSGDYPLNVSFTNSSTGSVTSLSWAFGDTGTSTAENPSHQYTAAGAYTVTLTVSGPAGSDDEVKTNYITVVPCTAAFSGSPLSGDYPLDVSFTNSSTGSITSWSWAFGDTGTSTAQSPSHQYTAAGTYTVTLTATGPAGSDDEVKTGYVVVTSPPPVDAQFSANTTSGYAPLSVNFTDNSTGTVTAWSWAFGDTGTSTAQNPGHQYTAGGVYDVSLAVTGPFGSDSLIRAEYITVTACTANFSGAPTSGVYPLQVSFTDSSAGSITSRSWTFGDGGTSTATNPSHTYQYAGAFSVTLTATGSYGSNALTRTDYISVTAPETPAAAFSGSPVLGTHPLTVNYTDQSTGSITGWSWAFGDSGTSTAQNPSHEYANPGAYTVSLTTTGASGSDIETKTNYITALEHVYSEAWGTYNSSNTGSAIGNNTINGAGSSGGTAWICTNGAGIAKYDGTTWTKYTTTAGLANNTVYAVAFDGSGNKWVATNGGVNKYDGSSWTKYTSGNSALASNSTRAIAVDTSGDVWVATLSAGICKFNGSSWTQYKTTNSGLAANAVRGVAVDSSNNKWIATSGGVSKYDNTTWTTYGKPPLVSEDTAGIAVVSGNVWVATLSGVNKFNGSSWVTYTTTQGLAENDSLAICGDSDGTVWVGSNGSGASKFASSSWTKYNTTNSGLAHNTVKAVAADGLARWFGTGGSGASKLQLTEISATIPDANFTASPTSGAADLTVNFTDSSTNTPDTWTWSFGDTGTSTEQNPTHIYETAGTYTVSLIVANEFGSDSKTRTNYIVVTPAVPIPNFQATPTDGIYPLNVAFTDKSTGCIDTWKYDFDGNGTFDVSDSSNGNETWTYNALGVYTVCLKVRDCSTGVYYNCIKTNLINARNATPPDANFTASKTTGGFAPQRIDFTDLTTGDGINGWSWAFGDNGTSTAQNPSHIYTNGGTFTVSLTASSSYGSSDIMTRTNYIVVGPQTACDANLTGTPLSGFSPLKVQFTDLTYGSVTAWSWTFGDSGTSTDMNPLHTYNVPGTYSVALTATGPLNSDNMTRTNYVSVQIAPAGGSGFAIVDSPADLDHVHPYLVMKGYGTENGMWSKATTTHSDIWERLTRTAPTGATYPGGVTRALGITQKAPFAYLISKINGYGQYCQDMVRDLNGFGNWPTPGGSDDGTGSMETFWGYCIAYDAIADDPSHGGPTWLNSSEKASAIATMAEYLSHYVNMDPGETWRVRPTHNYMVARAGCQAAGLYNLRGEAGYESAFTIGREYCLAYHNERINGLCNATDNGPAPLSNNGPRPLDGFPVEGTNYGAYQGSRALVHRHIMEVCEYPNPDTVLDENKSGFAQNYGLAFMSLTLPGGEGSADVCYRGDGGHGVLQGFRYYSAINKAVGVSDVSIIPACKMAGLTEWYTQALIPTPRGDADDQGWWQGFEYIWYDATIDPLTPAQAGLPTWVHLDDTEFHMYRSDWNIGSSAGTYVYFDNRGHDGHNYWNEGHSGSDYNSNYNCTAQTTSHDGADNGHFGIWKGNDWLSRQPNPDGKTDDPPGHSVSLIDGHNNFMGVRGARGYEVPEFITADCIGAVDSTYGHAIDAVMGGIYGAFDNLDDYHRYFFVLEDPLCVLVADDVESGHTIDFWNYKEQNVTKVSDDVYTSASPSARYELLWPQSGYIASLAGDYMKITTTGQYLLWMVHTAPEGVSFSKSFSGGKVTATIGSNTVVYNPAGSSYTGTPSGNAILFAQKTGGAVIFKATSATGSQYGLSCNVRANLSASGRKAQIYVYGTGTQTVTVTSPYGTDTFAGVPAGQTVSKVLTGYSAAPPVADFVAIPLVGWNEYIAPEFISFSSGWITDYLWEFGDGEWSTEMAPHHKYQSAGIYTIKLTVAGPGGSSSVTKSNYITINDFANYNWPDYILTSPSFASFTSALESIEASQTVFYTEKPEWCNNGKWTPWCDVVTTLQGHGGGGRILFAFSNTTIEGNWDTRIDPIKTWGDSNGKYDWVGDQLIIDGEDKNVTFHYSGSIDCGQAENNQALRIHGCDNIVRNIGWVRFPDGIHMRHGMRMLFEGLWNPVVCEDTMSMNGVGGACQYCTSRNNTFGTSADKTQMYNTAEGWRGLGPGYAVICGMHSTDASQAIRMTSSEGGTRSILIVRNSHFEGNAQGPRFGGKMDSKPPEGAMGAFSIFENNYATTTKGGSCGGMRIGEGIHMIVRKNIFENSSSFGVYTYSSGAFVRFEQNMFINNESGGVTTSITEGMDINYDLGGGLVDVWEIDPAGSFYGASAAARTAVPSCGQNTFQDNGAGLGLINEISDSPQPTVKAENNFWKYTSGGQVLTRTTVAAVLANDVTGSVDVDPLGIDPNSP